jgi:hypothetical protein
MASSSAKSCSKPHAVLLAEGDLGERKAGAFSIGTASRFRFDGLQCCGVINAVTEFMVSKPLSLRWPSVL